MAKELKRRDLSGIYIFDTFPGESHRRPTCIEDLCNYLVTGLCVIDEQRTEFFKMIDRDVERAKYNWAPHEMVSQVDFFCEKATQLADACGVTRHKE